MKQREALRYLFAFFAIGGALIFVSTLGEINVKSIIIAGVGGMMIGSSSEKYGKYLTAWNRHLFIGIVSTIICIVLLLNQFYFLGAVYGIQSAYFLYVLKYFR